ncbi:hypothetical protein Bca4012_063062 [Brassica carinata]
MGRISPRQHLLTCISNFLYGWYLGFVAGLVVLCVARNAKKGGELMGVDMLLLDDQSFLIQASVSVNLLNTFRELLQLHISMSYCLTGRLRSLLTVSGLITCRY